MREMQPGKTLKSRPSQLKTKEADFPSAESFKGFRPWIEIHSLSGWSVCCHATFIRNKVCVFVCLKLQKAPLPLWAPFPLHHLRITSDWSRCWDPLLRGQCWHCRSCTLSLTLAAAAKQDDPPAHMTSQTATVLSPLVAPSAGAAWGAVGHETHP